ncbi:MAG: hypothetical protein ACI8RD_008384 [Bacillariaceae sp.]|jgi:hypothetical protein
MILLMYDVVRKIQNRYRYSMCETLPQYQMVSHDLESTNLSIDELIISEIVTKQKS